MNQDNRRIAELVEQICHKGCSSVRQDIARIQNGEMPAELVSCEPSIQDAVYRELSAIMAVYGDSCPSERPDPRKVSGKPSDSD